jgi:DNA-binding GntR family transcriptional regulator
MADLGHHFHARINSAAGSRRLAQMLGIVTNQLPRRFYATIEGQGDDSREEHPRILDSLRRGAAEEARDIMEHHILAGADHLIAGLRQRGLWSDAPEA